MGGSHDGATWWAWSRKPVRVLVVAVAALSLVAGGCGNDDDGTENPPTQEQQDS